MSIITPSVGLISGLDIGGIVDALINAQRASARRLESRAQGFSATQSGLSVLEANLLSLNTAAQTLNADSTFESVSLVNSQPSQLTVTNVGGATPGSHTLQVLQRATAQQQVSRGFASAAQTLTAGELVIAAGGEAAPPTPLDLLNGGQGVQTGKIRVTDRSGTSADIDLGAATTVDDVLKAINGNTDIQVRAAVDGDHFVLYDETGATTTALSVIDLNGGSLAADLGIDLSVAADTLAGDAVYQVTEDFTFNLINDGNALHQLDGVPSLQITLTDDTVLEVTLDDTFTIGDVMARINDHEDNGGKVAASLVDGRIILEDTSGGGGSSAFAVESIGGSNAAEVLGLDNTPSGTTITGDRLSAGMNSVLLKNLNGGAGIGTLGDLQLTDRTGATATLDLSAAESLDEVISAINAATAADTTKLQITARVNDTGTGILITDTSGATASNLIIADSGGATLAADLGIEVDAATTSVNSGSLERRYINEATTLDDYARDGDFSTGSFRITDSAGNSGTVTLSSSSASLGDVIQRINAVAGISVTAALNEHGDGIVLIDDAAGAGTLAVEGLEGDAAEDLRLTGEVVTGGDGKQRILSRMATVVTIEQGDTLTDVVNKINDDSTAVTASIADDGTLLSPFRLALTANASGAASRFFIEDGTNSGFSFTTRIDAQDSVLRVGANPNTAFLRTSSTNKINGVAPGLNVELFEVGSTPAELTVSRNTSKLKAAVQSFVSGYNNYVSASDALTVFNAETRERGVLQGQGVVLRTEIRLQTLATRSYGDIGDDVRSLVDLGIRLGEGGKLVLDEERLDELLADDPSAVEKFFTNETNGFASALEDLVDSLTDPFDGTLVKQRESLEDNVELLAGRIVEIDALLEVRRERLLNEFIRMESAIGQLTSQQSALDSIRTTYGP